jgi:hypothetical protein
MQSASCSPASDEGRLHRRRRAWPGHRNVSHSQATVDQYRGFLEEVRTDTLVLPNCDLDTGQRTKAAEYSLTDDTYAKLLAQLSERKFDLTSLELRDNILQFYSDLSIPIETKKDQVRWQGVLTSLDQLKSAAPVPTVAGSTTR